MKEYMSSTELMRYLHMSGRKVVYLLEHNYIPYVNTGKTTHKYQILRKDAENFKLRLEKNPFLLSHLNGQFSSRQPKPKAEIKPLDHTALNEYLTKLWKTAPDALTLDQAAKLLGTNWTKLLHLHRDGELEMIVVMGKKYFLKENIIEYLVRPEVARKPKIGNYKEVIKEFERLQCLDREHKKKGPKRGKGQQGKKKHKM